MSPAFHRNVILILLGCHSCIMAVMFRYKCSPTDPELPMFKYSKQLISDCAHVHYQLEHASRGFLILALAYACFILFDGLLWLFLCVILLEIVDFLDYKYRYNEDLFFIGDTNVDFNTIKMSAYAILIGIKIFNFLWRR